MSKLDSYTGRRPVSINPDGDVSARNPRESVAFLRELRAKEAQEKAAVQVDVCAAVEKKGVQKVVVSKATGKDRNGIMIL